MAEGAEIASAIAGSLRGHVLECFTPPPFPPSSRLPLSSLHLLLFHILSSLFLLLLFSCLLLLETGFQSPHLAVWLWSILNS